MLQNKDIKPELIGCCGFFCGCCPDFFTNKCKGCFEEGGEGCFTYRCVINKGLRFCGECADFPCNTIIKEEKVTVLDKEWLKWKKKTKNMR